jgi:hypothetical protein
MGISFVKQYNPDIDWTLGTLKFDDYHTLTCPIHPRPANVDVIHPNAIMAREIMKRDSSTVFFCAILKECDATSSSYTNDTLDS